MPDNFHDDEFDDDIQQNNPGGGLIDGQQGGALVDVGAPSIEERFRELSGVAERLADEVALDPDEALFRAVHEREFDDVDFDDMDDLDDLDELPVRPPVEKAWAGPTLTGLNVQQGNPMAIEGPQGRAVANVGANAVAIGGEAKWTSIFELPGYLGGAMNIPARMRGEAERQMGAAIRNIGRRIFSSMPCFATMERECRQLGRDPLGEVQVLANIQGNGPNSKQEIDTMANWIRANGVTIDGGRMSLDDVFGRNGGRPYNPSIILAVSETDSFLMVDERVENGCPVNATYVYSWKGGRQIYIDNPQARITLNGLVRVDRRQPVVEQPRQQIQHVVEPNRAIEHNRVDIAPNRGVDLRREDRIERPVEPRREDVVIDVPVRKPVRETVKPVIHERPSRESSKSPMQVLRERGFTTIGTNEGPALKKECDGGIVILQGSSGKSLALSKSFDAKVLDSNGETIHKNDSMTVDEVIEFINNLPTKAPRLG